MIRMVSHRKTGDTEEKFKRQTQQQEFWKTLKGNFSRGTGPKWTVKGKEIKDLIEQTQITDVTDAISKIDALLEKYGERANKVEALKKAVAQSANEDQIKEIVDDAVILIDCLEYVKAN